MSGPDADRLRRHGTFDESEVLGREFNVQFANEP